MSLIIKWHDKLQQSQKGAYLGVDYEETNLLDYAPIEKSVALIGSPGSGKSTGMIAQSIVTFPGLVVATTCKDERSAKPDIVDLTYRARQEIAAKTGGVVLELAVNRNMIPTVERVSWDIVGGCSDWCVAEERARCLAFATLTSQGNDGVSHKDVHVNRITTILAPLLYYTAITQKDTQVLIRAINDVSGDKFFNLLKKIEDSLRQANHTIAANELASGLYINPESKMDIQYLIKTTIKNLPVFEKKQIQLTDLLKGHSTIYIKSSANTALSRLVAPFVSTFIQSLIEEYKNNRNEEGHPQAILLALDEVVNVSPMYNLPEIIRTQRGNNVQTMLAIQDVKTLDNYWANQAIIENCIQVLFPNSKDTEYLKKIEMLSGRKKYIFPLNMRGISETDATTYLSKIEEISRGSSFDARFDLKDFEFEFKDYLYDKGISWKHFKQVVSEVKEGNNLEYQWSVHDLFRIPKDEVLVIDNGAIVKRKIPFWKESPFWKEMFFQN